MPQNLLIVDDEPQICKSLMRLLRHDGYAIQQAHSPAAGLELLAQHPFDVVMSDYKMPHVTGVEFLSEVSQRYPDTVRLMLSGQADMQAVIEAVNSGSIFKFVMKPWSNDGIRDVISEAFALSQSQRQTTDDESGWLTRAAFLEQQVTNTDHSVVVGEWCDAARGLAHLPDEQRQLVFGEFSQRLATCLDVSGDIGLIEKATFACIAADGGATNPWQGIQEALAQPVSLGDGELRATFRFGVASLADTDLDNAMRSAMVALENSRDNEVLVYSQDLGQQVHRRRTLETDLHHAIARDELFYELQPQWCTATNQIISAEALLRWQHPRLGLISPLHIIDMAEQNGLIDDIGSWIAQAVCQQSSQWQNKFAEDLRLSINVSPRQFLQGDVIADLTNWLAQYQLDPSRIEVEITESCVMQDAKRCASRLAALADVGVRIALDDFGTGYSSLAQLAHLPIHVLKIDRSFIRDIDERAGDAYTMLQQVFSLAKNLGLETVAEGVETQTQYDICVELGCELIQGYLISKPIAVVEFESLWQQGHH